MGARDEPERQLSFTDTCDRPLAAELGNGAANGDLAALSGHTDLKAASETSGARL